MTNHEPQLENFAIVVLAAGQSSRLGQMKQLLPINNKVLIVEQLERALAVSNNVYCVLGYQAQRVQTCIDHLPITTIINNDWTSGMASSIAAGICGLAPNIQAVMIILVDQWRLTPADIKLQESCWQKQPEMIAVAKQGDLKEKLAIGPPVIFPRNYFAELSHLTGEQGAKSLLMKHKSHLLMVTLEHAFTDVDTPEQLLTMTEFLNNQ